MARDCSRKMFATGGDRINCAFPTSTDTIWPMTDTLDRVAKAPLAKAVALGEELPIFCETCGYSLHGLAQTRCEHCNILHFVCPECGHHQPINTLRPAAQRILGRMRAWVLGFMVFFRLNFFGWLLFAWFMMGAEWSYKYRQVGASWALAPFMLDRYSFL